MFLLWSLLWILLSFTFFVMLITTFLNHKKHKSKKETKSFFKVTSLVFILGFFSFAAMIWSVDLSATSSAPVKITENTKVASNYYEEKEKVAEEKSRTIADKEKLDEEKKKLTDDKEKLDEEKKKLTDDKGKLDKNKEKSQKSTKENAEKKPQSKEQKSSVIKEVEQKLVTDSSLLVAPVELEEVTVAKFIDGDTTRFYYKGKDTSFRYLLIDTPETKHPRVGEQPFGPEASARTEELLSNANVIEVEHDIGEKTDKYDRHLAYIWVDGVMLNEILVREGLAEVSYIYPPNTRHLERLKEAERLAQAEQIGIWSLPSSFDDSTYNNSNKDNQSNNDSTPDNSSGTVDDSYRDNPNVIPDAPTSFQNCTEMRKWYPNGVGADHPAYAPKHDRDRDGWACEAN